MSQFINEVCYSEKDILKAIENLKGVLKRKQECKHISLKFDVSRGDSKQINQLNNEISLLLSKFQNLESLKLIFTKKSSFGGQTGLKGKSQEAFWKNMQLSTKNVYFTMGKQLTNEAYKNASQFLEKLRIQHEDPENQNLVQTLFLTCFTDLCLEYQKEGGTSCVKEFFQNVFECNYLQNLEVRYDDFFIKYNQSNSLFGWFFSDKWIRRINKMSEEIQKTPQFLYQMIEELTNFQLKEFHFIMQKFVGQIEDAYRTMVYQDKRTYIKNLEKFLIQLVKLYIKKNSELSSLVIKITYVTRKFLLKFLQEILEEGRYFNRLYFCQDNTQSLKSLLFDQDQQILKIQLGENFELFTQFIKVFVQTYNSQIKVFSIELIFNNEKQFEQSLINYAELIKDLILQQQDSNWDQMIVIINNKKYKNIIQFQEKIIIFTAFEEIVQTGNLIKKNVTFQGNLFQQFEDSFLRKHKIQILKNQISFQQQQPENKVQNTSGFREQYLSHFRSRQNEQYFQKIKDNLDQMNKYQNYEYNYKRYIDKQQIKDKKYDENQELQYKIENLSDQDSEINSSQCSEVNWETQESKNLDLNYYIQEREYENENDEVKQFIVQMQQLKERKRQQYQQSQSQYSSEQFSENEENDENESESEQFRDQSRIGDEDKNYSYDENDDLQSFIAESEDEIEEELDSIEESQEVSYTINLQIKNFKKEIMQDIQSQPKQLKKLRKNNDYLRKKQIKSPQKIKICNLRKKNQQFSSNQEDENNLIDSFDQYNEGSQQQREFDKDSQSEQNQNKKRKLIRLKKKTIQKKPFVQFQNQKQDTFKILHIKNQQDYQSEQCFSEDSLFGRFYPQNTNLIDEKNQQIENQSQVQENKVENNLQIE